MSARVKMLLALSTVLGIALLSACEGDTGPEGPAGPAGPPGNSPGAPPEVFDQVEVLLTNTTTKPVGQIDVTAPGNGFVLVQAVFDVNLSKNSSVEFARAFFSLHTDGTTQIPNVHEVAVLRVSGETTMLPESFIMPVTIQRMFQVNSGQQTYFLRGARNDNFGSNVVKITNKSLSAIFIPA